MCAPCMHGQQHGMLTCRFGLRSANSIVCVLLETPVPHLLSLQEDDCAVLAVVDLHGGHPLPSITQHGSQIRVKQCMVHQVDYQLFASRPGLAILQAAWHPHSDSHLVALSSDNRLRMYSLSDLSMAEQTLHLKLNTPTAGTGKAGGYGLAAAVGAEQAAAFAFGPSIGPWGPFTVYIQAASGGVFSVCPLAPFGEWIRTLHLLDVRPFYRMQRFVMVPCRLQLCCWVRHTQQAWL